MNGLEFIKKHKFIAIFRHIPKEHIARAARAVYDGGCRLFEITFDPSSPSTESDTAEMIKEVRRELGEGVSVGAGTVINKELAAAAKEAGAEFLVSPCTKPEVIQYAKENGLLVFPGAYTPTEIVNAYELGADAVKIFPVLPNELNYLKVVTSPLSHIPFIPTGGINPDTIKDFLGTGAIAVAAGATVVTKDLVLSDKYDTITENTKRHLEHIV